MVRWCWLWCCDVVAQHLCWLLLLMIERPLRIQLNLWWYEWVEKATFICFLLFFFCILWLFSIFKQWRGGGNVCWSNHNYPTLHNFLSLWVNTTIKYIYYIKYKMRFFSTFIFDLVLRHPFNIQFIVHIRNERVTKN